MPATRERFHMGRHMSRRRIAARLEHLRVATADGRWTQGDVAELEALAVWSSSEFARYDWALRRAMERAR